MPKPLDAAELQKRFVHHAPAGQRIEAHTAVRRRFVFFADEVNTMLAGVGPCREAALAFTALEEASFWAHAAIARNMADCPSDVDPLNVEPAPPSL